MSSIDPKRDQQDLVKLTPDRVRDIRLLIDGGMVHRNIAIIHGVSRDTIQKIATKKLFGWVE